MTSVTTTFNASTSLGGAYFENEFVVHLQQHAVLKPSRRQAFGQFYHGQFDDVGRRPLNRGVHSRPLGKTAAIEF